MVEEQGGTVEERNAAEEVRQKAAAWAMWVAWAWAWVWLGHGQGPGPGPGPGAL